MQRPPIDQFLASAIHVLIQGQHQDVALLLLFCEAAYKYSTHLANTSVILTGPLATYQVLELEKWDETGEYTPTTSQVFSAFRAVTPVGCEFNDYDMRVQLVDIEPGWREELKDIAQGRGVHNQGVEIPNREYVLWRNLRFRAQSEVRVAQALDAMGVLYLPNCLARLNKDSNSRTLMEPDFLVCSKGKWGILEVDGPFHPRAATDHERDRMFQAHGIKVTQRFPAEDCYADAPKVVRKFLTLLEQNG